MSSQRQLRGHYRHHGHGHEGEREVCVSALFYTRCRRPCQRYRFCNKQRLTRSVESGIHYEQEWAGYSLGNDGGSAGSRGETRQSLNAPLLEAREKKEKVMVTGDALPRLLVAVTRESASRQSASRVRQRLVCGKKCKSCYSR